MNILHPGLAKNKQCSDEACLRSYDAFHTLIWLYGLMSGADLESLAVCIDFALDVFCAPHTQTFYICLYFKLDFLNILRFNDPVRLVIDEVLLC